MSTNGKPNIAEIDTLEKLKAALPDIPNRKPEPIPVPMELLDAVSQAALSGWCIGRELTGNYVLALVPAEAPPEK